ncbi:DNA-methyltransferase [Mycobacterium sp. ML4]
MEMTSKLHYSDDQVTLYLGDALSVIRELPDGAVDCVVTSPPYYSLRDYGVEGQYGLEASPTEYVETMRAVFAELRRVLADDGTLWLNLGDSYYSGRGNPGKGSVDRKNRSRRGWARPLDKPGQSWAKPKELLGIPWRVSQALTADGWRLRSAITWHKVGALPEPTAKDRPNNDCEMVFLLVKSRNYWFDPESANLGAVWSIPVERARPGHPAPMPIALAEQCITAGCKPSGAVLDPFGGAGATGVAALNLGHRYVGIDIKPEYVELARCRLQQRSLECPA